MFFEKEILDQAFKDLMVCAKFVLSCAGLGVWACGIGVGLGISDTNILDDYFKGKRKSLFHA